MQFKKNPEAPFSWCFVNGSTASLKSTFFIWVACRSINVKHPCHSQARKQQVLFVSSNISCHQSLSRPSKDWSDIDPRTKTLIEISEGYCMTSC